MAKLTGQTIADSYDQLLIVDHADGISSSLQAIESADTGGATSALQISTVGICVSDPTTSSATEGALLRLQSNDSAAVTGSGHRLGIIEFSGEEDANDTMVAGAQIYAIADAAFTATGTYDHATRLEFAVQNGTSGSDGLASPSMTIDSTGNVGIGTAAPGAKLELRNTTGSTGAVASTEYNLWLRNSSTGNADCGGIAFLNSSDDGSVKCALVYKGDTSGYNHSDLQFLMDNTEDGSHVAVDTDAALTIKADGKVGIGTVSPEALLHMYGNTSSNTRIMIDEDGTGDPYLHLRLTGGQDWSVGIDNSDSDKFMIGSDNAPGTDPHLVITTGGFIGIGTIDPSYGLQVGTTTNDTTKTIASYNRAGHSASAGGHFLLASGHTNDTVNAGDRLGIISFHSTEAAGGALVNGAMIEAFADATWVSTGTYRHGARLHFSVQSAGEGTTLDAPAMVIDSTGYVGIGTDAPISKLNNDNSLQTSDLSTSGIGWTIDEASKYVQVLKQSNTTGYGLHIEQAGNSAGDPALRCQSSDGVVFTVHNDGNVGIGTSTPKSQLHIEETSANDGGVITLSASDTTAPSGTDKLGKIVFKGRDSDTYATGASIDAIADGTWGDLSADDDDAPTMLRFSTQSGGASDANLPRMVIDSSGNVGINKTDPAYALDVKDAGGSSSYIRAVRTDGTASSIIVGARDGGTRLYSRDTGSGDMPFSIQIGTTDRLAISTAGVITISQLTASQDVQTDGSKNLTSVSDMNWKNDLGLVENGLDIVNSFKPHYFDWTRDAEGNDVSEIEQPRLAGFFAQEIYDVFPEGSPGGANIDEDGDEHWGLNSRSIMAVMSKAIQELSAKVTALENA